MRFGLTALCLFIAACQSEKPDAVIPSADPSFINKAQSIDDKIDSRISASVVVARENSNNPSIIEKELDVALSYLPTPTPGELLFVRNRVKHNLPDDYVKAKAEAERLKKESDALWANVEVERTKSANQIKALQAEIVTLKADVAKAKKEKDAEIYALAAIALMGLGGLAIAFSQYKAGVSLLICGITVGATPYLLESIYFIPALSLLILSALGFALWHFITDGKKASA